MPLFGTSKKRGEAADASDLENVQIENESQPQSIRTALKRVNNIATASIWDVNADRTHRQLDSATTEEMSEEMSPGLVSAMSTSPFRLHQEGNFEAPDLAYGEDTKEVRPPPEDTDNIDSWCIIEKNQVVLDLKGFTEEFETYTRIIPALLDVKPPSQPEYVPDLSGLVKRKEKVFAIDGGYSTVFMGEYQGVTVAIKVLRVQKDIAGATVMRRFWREAWTWWCLDHENILRLYGVVKPGEFGTFGAMISPWCELGPASDYLPRYSDIRERLQAFHGVAKGLTHLHAHSIVHGDLKPSNVLIDEKGNAKICDFGLLRLIRDQSTGLTTTTNHARSIRYLSFELITVENSEATPGSDVHALGCVGMEFIYSWIPYHRIPANHHRADMKIGTAIEKGEPPALRPKNLSKSISELWDTIESTWARNPQARPGAYAVSQFLTDNREKIAGELGSDPIKPTSKAV